MRRRLLSLLLATAFVAGLPAALAAPATPEARLGVGPSPAEPGPPPGARATRALADLDGDGISDDLAPRLRRVPPERRLPVIVSHDGSLDPASARRAAGALPVDRRFRLVDAFLARATPAQVRILASLPAVHRVEGDAEVRVALDASRADFGVDAARDTFGVSGTGIEICVVDTGADPDHEQLDSRIVAFRDLVGGLAQPYDDNGHGTHVASIAAGDGIGGPKAANLRGVAPGAALAIAKVLNDKGGGSASATVAGIEWCASRPSTDVISMSLATQVASDGSDVLSLAVNAAAATGKVVVAAAGNTGDLPMTIGSPGAAARAITVGAVAEWSAPPAAANRSEGVYLAPFSSRGPTLDGRTKPDVVAPGVSVTAARQGTVTGYATFSGTSMAAPFVAGTIALALEAGVPPASAKAWVRRTAQDRGVPGADPEWGAGLLDALALAAWGAGQSRSTPVPAATHLHGTVSSGQTWSHAFSVGEAALGIPIAATIVIDGGCASPTPFGCLDLEWAPDLDARLRGPGGATLAESTCIAGPGCGVGRQETLTTVPMTVGTYTIEVYPWADDGGSFLVDLSSGPIAAPPPPPVVHVGDLDAVPKAVTAKRWRARVVITVHDGDHEPAGGVEVRGRFRGGVARTCVTNGRGRCVLDRVLPASTPRAGFRVVRLVPDAATYLPTGNHDPDGDSDGTRIIVPRP
jgi:serine protease AprX